jgi:hypothetical protein
MCHHFSFNFQSLRPNFLSRATMLTPSGLLRKQPLFTRIALLSIGVQKLDRSRTRPVQLPAYDQVI